MALQARPEKANQISGLMITAIAGGGVVTPVIGFVFTSLLICIKRDKNLCFINDETNKWKVCNVIINNEPKKFIYNLL